MGLNLQIAGLSSFIYAAGFGNVASRTLKRLRESLDLVACAPRKDHAVDIGTFDFGSSIMLR